MTKKVIHRRPPALHKKAGRLKPQVPELTPAQQLAAARARRDELAYRTNPNRRPKLDKDTFNTLINELIELESLIIELMSEVNSVTTKKVVYR